MSRTCALTHRRRLHVGGLVICAIILGHSGGIEESVAQTNERAIAHPPSIALTPGAELFHGSSGFPFTWDLFVPPRRPQQTVNLFYRTSAIPLAGAVLWHVSSVPFPPFSSEVEAARKPPGLVDWGYVHHGKWAEGSFGFDVSDLGSAGRLPMRDSDPDYFVRILPIASLQSPVILGTPSNVIRIVRREPLSNDIKIQQQPPYSGLGAKYHNGTEPFDLGEVIYVDHPEVDRDGDGLKDSLEFALADRFKPLFVFDSAEKSRLPNEPVVLFQVRPRGTVGVTKPPYVQAPRIIIEYVFLFQGCRRLITGCPTARSELARGQGA